MAQEHQGGFFKDLFAPIAGFGVSFSTMFRKLPTEEYPEVKWATAPRYHGRHQLNRHPDGLEKCVGCELCAWACPADAILVEGANNDDTPAELGGTGRYSPGERFGRVYQINYLRCIFCGLCIEACPTRALTMTNFYELADDNRADLIFTKEQLLVPLQSGMLAPPHPMAEGMEERDYYLGKVERATSGQQAWADAQAGSGQSAAPAGDPAAAPDGEVGTAAGQTAPGGNTRAGTTTTPGTPGGATAAGDDVVGTPDMPAATDGAIR